MYFVAYLGDYAYSRYRRTQRRILYLRETGRSTDLRGLEMHQNRVMALLSGRREAIQGTRIRSHLHSECGRDSNGFKA